MLRTIFLLVSLLVFQQFVNAQFRKGDRMLGATIGTLLYNHSNTDLSNSVSVSSTGTDHFNLNFNPALGWFVSDNMAVGVSPVASYDKQKTLGKSGGSTFQKDETSRYNIGLGGFARYYFEGSEKARFFSQYDLAFGISGSNSSGYQYETYGVYVDRYDYSSSGDIFVNTGLSFGVSKFISQRTSIDFMLGYRFSYTKSNVTGNFSRDYTDPATGDITLKPSYDQKLTTHNVSLGVGLQFFLEKKK
jgi:hypothetical protein